MVNISSLWTPQSLEAYDNILWDDRQVGLYLKRVKPETYSTIVDVGCGTGFFTRILARNIRRNAIGVGVDLSQEALIAALQIGREKQNTKRIELIRSTAYYLPLPNNSADLTSCHNLLWCLERPTEAIKEIIRITRKGGTISALEPSEFYNKYYDDDSKTIHITERIQKAWYNGIKKIYHFDPAIGAKLPNLFIKMGLEVTNTHVFTIELSSKEVKPYYRVMLESEKKAYTVTYKKRLKRAKDEMKPILLAGGLTEDEISDSFDYIQDRIMEELSTRSEHDGNHKAILKRFLVLAKK